MAEPAGRPPLPDDPRGVLDGVVADPADRAGWVGAVLDSGSLTAGLARWAADARADEAAAARARERWLRQQADEEATFAGVLLDLAERGTPVVVVSASRRLHRGTVRAVGADFCVVHTDGGREVMVVLRAIAAVRPEIGGPAPVGDRVVALEVVLADALAALAAERLRVLVVTTSGEGLSGELRAVGRDVVTLRLDGDPRPVAYLPLAGVTEVSLA